MAQLRSAVPLLFALVLTVWAQSRDPEINEINEITETTPDPSRLSLSEYDCTKKEDGNYPYKSDCAKDFVTCSNGMAHLRKCPRKLYFSPKDQVCDTWYYIKTCSGNERTTTTTTKGPQFEKSTEAPEFDCSRERDGIFPHPTEVCARYFFQCSHGTTTKTHCPEGLFYDQKHMRCDRWTRVFECSGVEYHATTTPEPASTLAPPQHPIDCEGKENREHSDPLLSCSRIYYTCDNGRSYKRQCPHSMFFDEELQLCDSHNYVPACGGLPRTTPVPRVTELPGGDPNFDCTNKQQGNYGADNCVAFYYTCVGDVSFKMDCPPHLRYDAELDQCELAKYVPSCGGQRPTAPPSTTEKPTAKPLPIDCTKMKDGRHPDPAGCSQMYYSCANGHGFEFACPARLYFHPKLLECRRYTEACSEQATPSPAEPALPGLIPI